MKKQIVLQNKKINYTLRRSSRARRMRLAVYGDGNVVITIPRGFNESIAYNFILAKANWLLAKISLYKDAKSPSPAKSGQEDYQKYKTQAFTVVQARVDRLVDEYGFSYNRISIRNQKTCWGSCSAKRNLNFNYKIIFLPESLQNYIIVHELCHLKEFNHSTQFWALVANILPSYPELRKELKNIKINH